MNRLSLQVNLAISLLRLSDCNIVYHRHMSARLENGQYLLGMLYTLISPELVLLDWNFLTKHYRNNVTHFHCNIYEYFGVYSYFN